VYKMEKNEEMLLEIWFKVLESRIHEYMLLTHLILERID